MVLVMLPLVLAWVTPPAASISAATPTAITEASPSGHLPLKIHGVWYDAQPYAAQHPGGRWLLEYARGRDVTAIYRAIHMHGEAASAAKLRTLPVLNEAELTLPSRNGLPLSALQREQALQGTHVVELDPARESPLPPIDTPLRDELRAMMRRRFPTRASMKATPEHWVRTGVCLWACLSCWGGWLRFDPLSVLLLPFAQWLLAAHTVHGGHFYIWRRPLLHMGLTRVRSTRPRTALSRPIPTSTTGHSSRRTQSCSTCSYGSRSTS